jgi:hypothetical protein
MLRVGIINGTPNRIAFASAILLPLGIAYVASARGGEQQIRDVNADYALGVTILVLRFNSRSH